MLATSSVAAPIEYVMVDRGFIWHSFGADDVFFRVYERAVSLPIKPTMRGPVFTSQVIRSGIDGDDLEERGIGKKTATDAAKSFVRKIPHKRSLIDDDELEERGIGDVFNKVKDVASKLPGAMRKFHGQRSLVDGDDLEERSPASLKGATRGAARKIKSVFGGRSVDEDLFDRELEMEWE
jgi:hypothetical protein